MEAPESLAGTQLQCPTCKRWQQVPAPPLKNNLLVRAWQSTPSAFRVGFLTTMGVIAALMVSYWAYSHTVSPKPTQTTPTAQSLPQAPPQPSEAITPTQAPQPLLRDLEIAMAELDLFLVYKKEGILRGRSLTEYLYSPDANLNGPNVSVWTDQQNQICGVSAAWFWYDPIPTNSEMLGPLRPEAQEIVVGAFCTLTGLNLEHLKNLKFASVEDESPMEGIKRAVSTTALGPWVIHFSLMSACFGNETIDRFIATAQNW